MTSKTRALALGFALLGLGASATSSYVHYQIASDPTYTSFCDVSGAVSCTQAYLSQDGSILGVPVALLGVAFFAMVLMIVALAPKPQVIAGGKRMRAGERTTVDGESVAGYVFVLSTVGLAFSLYLAWASFFQLRAVCILCTLTYVAVLGLFIVSWRAQSVPIGALPGPRRAGRRRVPQDADHDRHGGRARGGSFVRAHLVPAGGRNERLQWLDTERRRCTHRTAHRRTAGAIRNLVSDAAGG